MTPVNRTKAREWAHALRLGAGGGPCPAADFIDQLCAEVEHLNRSLFHEKQEFARAFAHVIQLEHVDPDYGYVAAVGQTPEAMADRILDEVRELRGDLDTVRRLLGAFTGGDVIADDPEPTGDLPAKLRAVLDADLRPTTKE